MDCKHEFQEQHNTWNINIGVSSWVARKEMIITQTVSKNTLTFVKGMWAGIIE